MTTKHMFSAASLTLALAAVPAFAQAPNQNNSETQNQKTLADLPSPNEAVNQIQDAGRMVFMVADQNGDGQISQKEAVSFANVSVGGLFFQADTNGDGTLSQDEAKSARQMFMTGKPWLKYVVDTVKTTKAGQDSKNGQSPAQQFAALLDTNSDKQLQATELRQIVQTGVESAFATADTNRDGQLTAAELNAAVTGAGRALAQAEFQRADTDNNGQVSKAEYEKAIIEPSRVVFNVIDLNNDGQISEQEAQTIRQVVASKIQTINFPEPSNSPRNTANRVLGAATQPGTQNNTTTPAAPAAGQPAPR